MTTLAEITLQVAKQIDSVTEGVSTAGAATSITDTLYLTQPNGYFDQGTAWIRSGTHAGKVVEVTSFKTNVLTFATLTTSTGTGARYSVARKYYPWKKLVEFVNQALEETRVTGDDDTLTGDGSTLHFTLPNGVYDVVGVEYEDASGYRRPSYHWQERGGMLMFDSGHCPNSGETIHVLYKKIHDELVNYDDLISAEINVHWLKWKAAENALRWALRVYQADPQLNITTFLNEALQKTQQLKPRREPFIKISTAGG